MTYKIIILSILLAGRVSSGLQLSLQGQNLLFIQAFDEKRRLQLTDKLEKEKWKSSTLEFGIILSRAQNLPCLAEAFQLKEDEEIEQHCNGVNNNKGDIQSVMDKNPGAIIVS